MLAKWFWFYRLVETKITGGKNKDNGILIQLPRSRRVYMSVYRSRGK